MSLSELTDPNAILTAVREYDAIGQEAFLAKYGYGPARRYQLEYAGRRYDSKAIVGAAYGYQFPDRGPLAASEFAGGEATVRPLLERLGFTVVELDAAGFGITAQDIQLIRNGRSKSKFAELDDDERAAYTGKYKGITGTEPFACVTVDTPAGEPAGSFAMDIPHNTVWEIK